MAIKEKTLENTTLKPDGEASFQIDRDVRGKIYLLKVSFPLYDLHYSFL